MEQKDKESKAKKAWRGFLFYLPLLTSFAFALYNLYLWIAHSSSWNAAIFVYYVLLVLIHGLVLFSDAKIAKEPKESQFQRRYPVFLASSIVLFLINIALVVPISMLAMHEKSFDFGLIPAIAMAAYTTYKITMAIIRYKKSRKDDNLLVKEKRTIALIDACVSILSLQNTLILAVGDDPKSIMPLVACSSFAILAFILVISILSLVRGIKSKSRRLLLTAQEKEKKGDDHAEER